MPSGDNRQEEARRRKKVSLSSSCQFGVCKMFIFSRELAIKLNHRAAQSGDDDVRFSCKIYAICSRVQDFKDYSPPFLLAIWQNVCAAAARSLTRSFTNICFSLAGELGEKCENVCDGKNKIYSNLARKSLPLACSQRVSPTSQCLAVFSSSTTGRMEYLRRSNWPPPVGSKKAL